MRYCRTNLKGSFHTIRHLSRYFMKQKSGTIINISSVSGVMGMQGRQITVPARQESLV